LLVCLSLLCATAIGQEESAAADNTMNYRNPALAIDDRVTDLLSRMTLEEKIGQFSGGGEDRTSVIDPTRTFTDASARALLERWWDPDQVFTPKKSATLRNGIRRYLREKTRLGIPQLFMGEALHGFMQYSFPIPDFQTDASDITGLAFVSGRTLGKFEFEIDEVEIK
jgi:beta-glucosidase